MALSAILLAALSVYCEDADGSLVILSTMLSVGSELDVVSLGLLWFAFDDWISL